MSRSATAFRAAATALAAYCGFFILLSIDLLQRVWFMRAAFPRPQDVRTLFFFEICRSAVTLAAILIVLALAWRRRQPSGMRAFTFALAFATLAFTKAVAFRAFAGFRQEALARWLLAHDAPRALLSFFFGSPAWAAWLALGALLVFASRFPQPIDAGAVEASGSRDRAGLLKGAGLAGADVGAAFRMLTTALLRRGSLQPARVMAVSLAFAALHHVLRHQPGADAVAAAVAAGAIGVAVTLLRAGCTAADDVACGSIRRLRTGALAGGGLFLLAALTGPISELLSAGLLLLAPAAVVAGVGLAFFGKSTAPAVQKVVAGTD